LAHLVVANSDRQFDALRRGRDAFLAWPMGALSATAFSLHRRRDHPACARLEHSTLARQSLRGSASLGLGIRPRTGPLRIDAICLLGQETAHDRGAVHSAHDRMDPCLHWALFWLRLKPFFKWAWPVLFAIAVLLPPSAMMGAHHGAQEIVALAKDP